ncbi:MAG: tetratricopeptide repeat protein [Aggregatilineales bacterium]
MAGDQQAYEQAMNAGHSAAWDQDWYVAIAAYARAIREFPQDAEAHIHLGLSLLEVGRLEDAYKVYTRAHQLAPDDPIPLEKNADVLERMGRLREAAQQYISVSEVYLSQRDLNKAIDNWERATRLTPGLIPVHAKLAQAYERIGDKKKAVREYLTLAYNFQRTGDHDKAIKAAQRALRLDRSNPQTLNTLRALEAGGKILPPADDISANSARVGMVEVETKPIAREQETLDKSTLGPIGEAITDSLGLLATYVMEAGEFDSAADLLQALEAHRQGQMKAAIEAYRRAEATLSHPALQLNLGALLLLDNQPSDALRHLERARSAPELYLGTLHGLGQAYFKLGEHKVAARRLLECLDAITQNEAVVLDSFDFEPPVSIYRRLSDVIDRVNEEQLSAMNQRFIALLEGKEWRLQVEDTARQLEDTLREQGETGVVDILTAARSDKLTESIALIDRYMRQGQLILALDEAHHAVEFSPNYLPVHIRMAEIMMKEGRVRSAISKYNMIAKTYLARGENERAAEVLTYVLEIAPLDVTVRESLIELLESEERWSEALEQYIDLADAHHQLGDIDLARDTFMRAERLANRLNAPVDRLVHIKHRIADIEQMRLDMRRAQKTYEEIIQLDPSDERAHRMLVDLNYRQGNQVEAIRRLDKLLGLYARNKQANRITQLLEELVTVYPTNTALRSRLALIYRQLGRSRDAIVQLDALGELQLEAGQHKDAIETIKQIISLKPDNIEDYHKLLRQLGG